MLANIKHSTAVYDIVIVTFVYVHETVSEISQFDLEVWCSETLPDAPSILVNLA